MLSDTDEYGLNDTAELDLRTAAIRSETDGDGLGDQVEYRDRPGDLALYDHLPPEVLGSSVTVVRDLDGVDEIQVRYEVQDLAGVGAIKLKNGVVRKTHDVGGARLSNFYQDSFPFEGGLESGFRARPGGSGLSRWTRTETVGQRSPGARVPSPASRSGSSRTTRTSSRTALLASRTRPATNTDDCGTGNGKGDVRAISVRQVARFLYLEISITITD